MTKAGGGDDGERNTTIGEIIARRDKVRGVRGTSAKAHDSDMGFCI